MKMRATTKAAIQALIDSKTEVYRWVEPQGWSVINTPAYGVSMSTLRKYATYTKRPYGECEMLTVTGWRE